MTVSHQLSLDYIHGAVRANFSILKVCKYLLMKKYCPICPGEWTTKIIHSVYYTTASKFKIQIASSAQRRKKYRHQGITTTEVKNIQQRGLEQVGSISKDSVVRSRAYKQAAGTDWVRGGSLMEFPVELSLLGQLSHGVTQSFPFLLKAFLCHQIVKSTLVGNDLLSRWSQYNTVVLYWGCGLLPSM